MKYTKHNVIRTKSLTDKYAELIFERDNLIFEPGDLVEIFNSDSGGHPLLISSQVNCGWVRILFEKSQYPEFLEMKSVKLLNPKKYTTLKDSNATFVVAGVGIGVPFSIVSARPTEKLDVIYLGDERISMEYLRKSHCIRTELADMRPDRVYYMIGPRTDIPDIVGHSVEDYRW